jgi:NADH-quinone oxidoreductase subunit N
MIRPPAITTDILLQLAPMLVLLAGGLVFTMIGTARRGVGNVQRGLNVLVYVIVIVIAVGLWKWDSQPILNGMLVIDRFSIFFTILVSICALGTVLTSANYLERFGMNRGEFFAMVSYSCMGMVVLVSAYDLVSVFLGIELMSMPIYVLVAFRRRDLFSNEAALKYFLIGAFAIALFLYGVSIIYGITGTTNFKGIVAAISEMNLARHPLFLLGIALILSGLAFKVSSVPFHMWTPDVYQGAPTPITSFMATAVKASVALVQRNIKRMMAYSSIAHAGYIMIGLAALSLDDTRAASSIMYYVLVYAFMTLGTFAVISAIEKRGDTRGLEESDYAGLGLERPFLGLCMAAFMFSLAGIPPTAGFFAKYYVFSAAIEQGMVGLAIIGVLNSALSLYYYLRVVVTMFMRKGRAPAPAHDDFGVRVVLVVSVIAILWLGLGPGGRIPGVENVLEWTQISIARVISLAK